MDINKDFDRLYLSALRFLSHKPRTEYEVSQRLLRYQKSHNLNVNEDVLSQVIELLKQEKYINDTEYVNQFVSYQVQTGKKSLLLIQKFLLNKGINKSLISTVMSEYKTNDSTTAKIMASKKLKLLSEKGISSPKIRQKLLSYLLSKGIPFDNAADAVDSILGVK